MRGWIIGILRWLAVLFGVAAAGFAVGVMWPMSLPKPGEKFARLLIRDVDVVDVVNGALRPGQDILVEDGVIVAVGQGLAADGARVVDAAGRFAIPGLFDMHVHSVRMAPALTHPLFVSAGVTAVRDMGGCLGEGDAWVACAGDKRAWNAAVGAGTMVGPRYDSITSLAINGGSEIPRGFDPALGAATAEDGQTRAAFDAARGLDFLKPYTELSRAGFFALAEAARGSGMYLAGHVPLAVSGLEAVAAGQRSIEHAFLFVWDCYPGMAALRESADPRAVYTDELRRKMVGGHDAALCTRLHTAMIAAGAAYVPTHTTRKLDAFATDPVYLSDPRLRFIPAPLRLMWAEDAAAMAARAGPEGMESYRTFYEFGIEQTGVAHRAGVTVLAGTDSPDSFAFPGSALHDELAHFVAAGMAPLEALRAATIMPARFLGLDGEAGLIAPGARADIVLLDANPLENIAAVRQVNTVVLAGVIYDRAALDEMLEQVESTAASWTLWPKFVWQIVTSPIMRTQFAD